MRIVSKKNLQSFIFVVFVYCLIKIDSSACGNKKTSRKKSFVSLMFTRNGTGFNITENRKGCRWLKSLKHHYKLCMNRKGLPKILKDTRNLTVMSCYKYFRYEQWPCLIKKKFFKKVYRETAFMYSLVTSAFMYHVAKACSSGNLENCGCASYGKSDNPAEWKWGKCGDNSKFAKALTNKFFQLKKKGDKLQSVLKYNSEVGIEGVIKHEETICKCHGVSGSCTFNICFKKIKTFDEIALHLRNEYHNAIQVESDNTLCEKQKVPTDSKLIYLENPINFCPGTVGRQCENPNNCATLCCGRGFSTKVQMGRKHCNCLWRNDTVDVRCDQCEQEESIYICD